MKDDTEIYCWINSSDVIPCEFINGGYFDEIQSDFNVGDYIKVYNLKENSIEFFYIYHINMNEIIFAYNPENRLSQYYVFIDDNNVVKKCTDDEINKYFPDGVVTEDDVKIRMYDCMYVLLFDDKFEKNEIIELRALEWSNYYNNRKSTCFSTKEKAEEYSLLNEKMFSFMDIQKELNLDSNEIAHLKQIIKNKLCNKL